MPNRLSQEASPYLLQHAGNPVDWYPWGEAAFERARQADKPIFLSIGYSTCHWCHVMERESFENDAVADVLNDHFVAVKVDREERPDVDRVYMAFVQATTGSGGWPMSVWLTPALEPFFGGTYFPPTSRWGRPGFVEVLEEIARLWRDDRDRILQSASALTERLKAAQGAGRAEAASRLTVAGAEAIEMGADAFAQTFDRRRGGFGGAPKFPRPSELFFLLRAHACGRSPAAREMVAVTLRSMAEGGMYDQLGGGFHRYAVDAEWRVPHFEKMLYDQAQLVLALLEAAQATGDAFFADVAEETLGYVSRDLTDASGGFYSAEDADSVPPEEAADPRAHKSEGAFYLWRWAEVESLLGADADVVRYRNGLEPYGNALEDPQGELRGRNLLYVARPVGDVARLAGRSPEEVEAALRRARIAMSDVRARRPRPHLDDKILAGWNGLMIAAFARAARTLEAFHTPGGARATARWRESAERAARFLRTTMWDESREVLRRRYRAGEASIDAYSEDYAFVVWGLLELFQTTGASEWLRWATRIEARQDELFWDEADAGWFSTDGRDPSVLFRMKDDYDGAEPSAGSVSVLNLLAMAHLTGDNGPFGRAERTLQRYGTRLGQMARVLPMMMAALTTYHARSGQVAIVGPRDREDTGALRAALASCYAPFTVVVPIEPGADQAALAADLPWTSAMAMRGGRATAYVCEDFTCREPVTTPEDLKRALGPSV